eukprot:1159808-Pelagomonas_calceolata.AAC.2
MGILWTAHESRSKEQLAEQMREVRISKDLFCNGARHTDWIHVMALPTACVLFFKTRMVTSRVELVASLHPGVLLSPIVLATIAGCGGGPLV